MRQQTILGDLVRGWAAIFRSLGGALAVIISAAVVSIAVVYPLWWLAVRHRGAYSIAAIGIVVGTVIYFATSAILRSRRRNDQVGHSTRRRRAIRVVGAVAIPILAYITFVLYASAVLAGAIPLTLVVVAGIGLLVASGSRRPR